MDRGEARRRDDLIPFGALLADDKIDISFVVFKLHAFLGSPQLVVTNDVEFGGHRQSGSDGVVYQSCLILAVELLKVESGLVLIEDCRSVVFGDNRMV